MSISVPPRPSAAVAMKAGPIGPGAGVMMTEYLMPMMLPVDQQRRMRSSMKVGNEVSWIRAAERVISGKIAGDQDLQGAVGWHLEDPEGKTIDEAYDNPRAVEAYQLINHPTRALVAGDKQITSAEYQGQLWEITSRHMGIAGQGYWFLDGLDQFGVPTAILYIRPDRLWPICDASGNLTGWSLDPKNIMRLESGRALELREVIQFPLETPSEGFIAKGLVESAIMKAQLDTAIDRHLGTEVAQHGRLAGMFAPKAGPIDDDEVWGQIQRDMRNISEQPDAGLRMQLMRAPMEYTRTSATVQEMAIIDLMTKSRDNLLALWGVPLSQIGGATPAGLNSGDVRKYDEAALWQNAVTPRLVVIKQRIQRRLLDVFEPDLGWAPKLVLDVPEFDDDSPRFDKLQKSSLIALTNDERRALIGLDPLDESLLGPTGKPFGKETWLPITLTSVSAPPTPPADYMPKRIMTPNWSPNAQLAMANKPTPIAGAVIKAKGAPVIDAVMAALRKQWPEQELDIVKQGDWTFDPAFPIRKINAARRPIHRNPKIVAGVEAVLRVGAPISPVTLIHTKVLGKPGYEPIDGWHRTLAAIHAGLKKIPAYIGEGDAKWTEKLIAFDDDIPTPPDSAGQAVGKADIPARHEPIRKLRASLDATITPKLQRGVASLLDGQRREVLGRVRAHWDAIRAQPRDRSLWWPQPAAQDEALTSVMRPALMGVAQTVAGQVQEIYGGGLKADPVVDVMQRGATRVVGINQTTRAAIEAALVTVIEQDGTLDDAISALEDLPAFDEYRAEMVARTELMNAYNSAALASYESAGLGQVQAIDGDDDAVCAARNGQIYSLDDANAIEDHPNGTLDWVPVVASMS